MKSLDLRGFVTCTHLLYGIIRILGAGIVLPSPTTPAHCKVLKLDSTFI